MPDFYELLKVAETASFEEIKGSYKQLILQCHPDKLQQHDVADPNRECLGEEERRDQNLSDFNAINEAWNTLKDPIKRKHYDAELLQSKFQAHSNIYAHITTSDMESIQLEVTEDGGEADGDADADKETATVWTYAYDCRCGGQYLLDEARALDESTEQSGPATSDAIVECSECSLVIVVKPSPTMSE
ncbi:DPH4 homolog [Drosophila guanche]|uniref:Blast:DPH4 homolog n=1 Tax=Drosophila guanche TaxID=7266 RepID=A0A3B0KAK9_DROGU|nr:DPH4 homolog [Drosophila guanche]XP_034130083.1 DPH4 homolog [Drosophila guanche]SPP83129.1 blast:DPH4 homolog [Drosophila guanche]